MEPASLFLLISTLLFFFSLGITWWVHSQYRTDISLPPPVELAGVDELPPVCVIVPARNEGRNIRRCVEALLSQAYPDFQLIVVDDRSTDETPHILAEMALKNDRLRVVQGSDLPPGWAGKPHALALGVEGCGQDFRAGWLCFVDADTFAEPHLLQAAVVTARRCQADLFSILTDQDLGSFWEKTILPLVFTALSVGFPAKQVNDPNRPVAIANGQFILIRSRVYEAIGGHAAVRDQVAEDKALAELVKGRGYRLIMADGRTAARTRMYTSLAEVWEGWTKNIFLGMRDRPGLLFVGAITCLMGALALPLWLVVSLLWLLAGGGILAAAAVLQAITAWAFLLYFRVRVSLAFHISPLYALTLPLGLLVFTAMMFASAYNVLSGKGVSWKGRVYR